MASEQPPNGQEMGVFPHQPSMAYQPMQVADDKTILPTNEPEPRRVTPLSRLGYQPADVDCPHCRRVVQTKVRYVDSGNDDMMKCLICLVCWPMLCCYEGDQDIDHMCSICHRQLTHQPQGGQVQVIRSEPDTVPSRFE